jgi:hypothetical protein
LSSSTLAKKDDLGYITAMNKKRRIALLKHRLKRKKLKLRRKDEAAQKSGKSR